MSPADHNTTPEGTRFVKDDVIFNEGETGDTAYIILSGELGVYHNKWHRDKMYPKLICTLSRGELVGELCLFTDNARRSATISVMSDEARLLLIHKKDLEKELEAMNPAARILFNALVHRIRKTYGQVVCLS